MEIDGISLIGKISISRPAAILTQDSVRVSWKAWEKNGDVKIWLAKTNHFKEGGSDDYQLVGQAPVSKENYAFSIKNNPSVFYKIVLEAPYNRLNRWIIVEGK